MKKIIATITGVIALGVSLSAAAGPDWALIEQARQQNARLVQVQATQLGQADVQKQKEMNRTMEDMMKECAQMMKSG
jgi:hypothetical protein